MSALIGMDMNTLWPGLWIEDLAGCLPTVQSANGQVATVMLNTSIRLPSDPYFSDSEIERETRPMPPEQLPTKIKRPEHRWIAHKALIAAFLFSILKGIVLWVK